MKKYLFISGLSLEWHLEISATKQIKLRSVSEFELLNPIRYGNAYKDAKYLDNESITIVKEFAYFNTSGLILKIATTSSEIDFENKFEQLTKFLRYLKYTSQQFGLKCEHSISSMHYREEIKRGNLNISYHTTEMFIRQDHWNSLITWNNIKSADKLSYKDFAIPVYEEILLDAISDRNNYEYRKAILYSAIAIESILANTYDDYYDKLISRNKKLNKHRFIKQMDIDKDPIFKALTDKSDFRKLLHEIPLYLYNKSLLIENEVLFTDTVKLYTTRNKIVHWGGPMNSDYDKVFEINQDGANKAVGIAIRIFEWIGNNKFSNFKQSSFIKI